MEGKFSQSDTILSGLPMTGRQVVCGRKPAMVGCFRVWTKSEAIHRHLCSPTARQSILSSGTSLFGWSSSGGNDGWCPGEACSKCRESTLLKHET